MTRLGHRQQLLLLAAAASVPISLGVTAWPPAVPTHEVIVVHATAPSAEPGACTEEPAVEVEVEVEPVVEIAPEPEPAPGWTLGVPPLMVTPEPARDALLLPQEARLAVYGSRNYRRSRLLTRAASRARGPGASRIESRLKATPHRRPEGAGCFASPQGERVAQGRPRGPGARAARRHGVSVRARWSRRV
jgi:hypothetical protein